MKELAAGDGAGEGVAVGGTTPGLVLYPIDMGAWGECMAEMYPADACR